MKILIPGIHVEAKHNSGFPNCQTEKLRLEVAKSRFRLWEPDIEYFGMNAASIFKLE